VCCVFYWEHWECGWRSLDDTTQPNRSINKHLSHNTAKLRQILTSTHNVIWYEAADVSHVRVVTFGHMHGLNLWTYFQWRRAHVLFWKYKMRWCVKFAIFYFRYIYGSFKWLKIYFAQHC